MKQYFLSLLLALSLSSAFLEARFIKPSGIIDEQKKWNELKRECAGKSEEEIGQEAKTQFFQTFVAVGKVILTPIQDTFKDDEAYKLKNEWEKLKHVLELYMHCYRIS